MIKTSSRPFTFALAGFALVASASAANFSVSGAGGAIPDTVATPGTWNVLGGYTGTPFLSTVAVANPVTSITAVKISGFTHTWRGDLHIILKDPGNVAHNVVVRPGSTGGPAVGDSGDYLSGIYTFVTSGGGTVAQGTTNISGGTYNQFFNTGTGQWTAGIANTPLTSITGPAGNWTLEIRDWANLDIGSLTGWTLEGTDSAGGTPITPFCFGDGTGGACPCANNGAAGNGCANSVNASGANLAATGTASVGADTLSLNVTGQYPGSLSVVIQSATQIAAVNFGDGRRCLGGSLLRLFLIKDSETSSVSAPSAGSLPASPATVSGQSAALGDPLVSGSVRSYQVHYRDPSLVFCPGPGGATFNVTNGLQVTWAP